MTTTMDNIGQLWRNEFLRDLQQQRDLCAKSVASLKTNGGYRAAHERMLRLYDAAILAVLNESTFTTDADSPLLSHRMGS
jgi:hypothetical protein